MDFPDFPQEMPRESPPAPTAELSIGITESAFDIPDANALEIAELRHQLHLYRLTLSAALLVIFGLAYRLLVR